MKQYKNPKISNQVAQYNEQDNVLYHRSTKYRSSVQLVRYQEHVIIMLLRLI